MYSGEKMPCRLGGWGQRVIPPPGLNTGEPPRDRRKRKGEALKKGRGKGGCEGKTCVYRKAGRTWTGTRWPDGIKKKHGGKKGGPEKTHKIRMGYEGTRQ